MLILAIVAITDRAEAGKRYLGRSYRMVQKLGHDIILSKLSPWEALAVQARDNRVSMLVER